MLNGRGSMYRMLEAKEKLAQLEVHGTLYIGLRRLAVEDD